MVTKFEDMKIAVIIPCYNESLTISKVVGDFQRRLPHADIFVFDNNSTDDSNSKAYSAGATVIKEKRQGKGFVVSAMLKKVVADIYVMVDGDDTYPAEVVADLIQPIVKGEADMVVGQRMFQYSENAFRPFHVFGNRLVRGIINCVFSSKLQDPMSGYRVFTREIAIELPVVAYGFDVETEMTIQLLFRKFVIKEIPIYYRERHVGSISKLRTFRDGFIIVRKIFSIVRAYKPLTFFGGGGIIFIFIGFLLAIYSITRLLTLEPWDVLVFLFVSIICIISGLISGSVGLILHTLNFRLLELSSTVIKSTNNKSNG